MPDWSIMEGFRTRLDAIDAEIIRLFGERYDIRRQVGVFKDRHDLPLIDPKRVEEVVARAVENAKEHRVPADFAEALYRLVIDYSHKFEEEKGEEK